MTNKLVQMLDTFTLVKKEPQLVRMVKKISGHNEEAEEAYRWEREMHLKHGVKRVIDIEESAHLIHEISELLDIKPPRYYFYDGNDTDWAGYAQGKKIYLLTKSSVRTAVHEMAHYIDHYTHSQYRTGLGHGDSFKQILSLLFISLGYWPISSMSKSDYVEAFTRYMPNAIMAEASKNWDTELKNALKEHERQKAEAEARRKEAEAKEKELKRRISVIGTGCRHFFSEWFDFQIIEGRIHNSIGTGEFPVLEYIFATDDLELYFPWFEYGAYEDYWLEEYLHGYFEDLRPYIRDQEISSFDELINDYGGEDLLEDFVEFVITDLNVTISDTAYEMNPDLMYILCEDALDELSETEDSSYIQEIWDQRHSLKRTLSAHTGKMATPIARQ